MTDRELFKMALDALIYAQDGNTWTGYQCRESIEALRARLAQPEPKYSPDGGAGFIDGVWHAPKPKQDETVLFIDLSKLPSGSGGVLRVTGGGGGGSVEPTIDGWPLWSGLPKPEPEPVAWKDAPTKIYLQICDDVDCDLSFEAHDDVSWCQDKINDCDVAYVRADTAPPKKEWQGLTDEEIKYIAAYGHQVTANVWVENFARAIEAKLREKNG